MLSLLLEKFALELGCVRVRSASGRCSHMMMAGPAELLGLLQPPLLADGER